MTSEGPGENWRVRPGPNDEGDGIKPSQVHALIIPRRSAWFERMRQMSFRHKKDPGLQFRGWIGSGQKIGVHHAVSDSLSQRILRRN
jgi:hypothetical protein